MLRPETGNYAFEQTRSRIREHEGLVLKAYDDATGHLVAPGTTVKGYVSIGYGRNLASRGITLPEAELFLQRDLADAATSAAKAFSSLWETLDEVRQSVLAEMVYQMGIGKVKEFKVFLGALANGQTDAAAAAMLLSKWARTDSPRRAARLSTILKTGVWG